jgi:hypothetical protein
VPVRHEKRRLSGGAVRGAINNRKAPRIAGSGAQTRRRDRLQRSIDGNRRAPIQEVSKVAGNVAVGAVVVRERGSEKRAFPIIRAPFAARGVASDERIPCTSGARAPGGDDAVAGDNRPAGWEVLFASQLVEFLVQEFVIFLVAPPEHDNAADERDEAEQAERFLHGEPSVVGVPAPTPGRGTGAH